MASAQDNFALDWIKADLLETLNEARVALDDFAENGGDETRLRACLTSLHQVHGTLVMLEFDGITLLADHLERLAQAMLSDNVIGPGADQTLMQGILELPGYLDELQRGVADSRSAFIPLVNEVRDLLGLERLHDQAGASLLHAATDDVAHRFNAIDGSAKVVRMRSAYQNVLLSILKGEARGAAVATLRKIALGLQKLTEGSALQRQWQAFAEFIESLAKQEGALESEAVKLLRRVDLELKSLVRDGAEALRRPVNMDLVQQLLDAAAEREHENEVTAGLREALSRDSSNNTLAISGRQALSTAAVALRDELLVIKDKLDLMTRAQSIDLNDLRQLATPMKQIGSTLSLLGFESSREILTDQVTAIEDLVVLGDTDPTSVQSVAAALVQIDENLASIVRGSDQTEVEQITSDAQLQVLRETRNGIDQVKVAVVDFVTAEWDPRHLAPVRETLAEICGALEIIPLPRVIVVLEQAGAYIADRLVQGHQPDWEELDQFAEIISGIDYYLERLAEQNVSGAGEILQEAERAMQVLHVARAAANDAAEAADEAVGADIAVPVFAAGEVAPESDADTTPEVEAHEPEANEAEAQPEAEAQTDAAAEEEFDLGSEDFADLSGVVDEAPEASAAEETAEETAEQPEAVAAANDAPAVEPPDPEIVEIFVEEVDEVLENIDEWLPQWAVTLEPGEPLSEIRRAYHTLKGSGRIVQAVEIGELAWGIENMLNRVIDGTVEPTAQFVDVIKQARTLVGPLRNSFEEGLPGDLDAVSEILEQADVLASGGVLETPAVEDVSEVGETPIGEEEASAEEAAVTDEAAVADEAALTDEPAVTDDAAVTDEAADTDDAADTVEVSVIDETSVSEDVAANDETDADTSVEFADDELPQLAEADSEAEFEPEFEADAHAEEDQHADAAAETEASAQEEADAAEAVGEHEVVDSRVEDEAIAMADEFFSLDDLDLDAVAPAGDDQANEGESEVSYEDDNAMALFVDEAYDYLAVLRSEMGKSPWQLSEPIARAVHTLAGSAAIAGVRSVQEVVDPAYRVVEACRKHEPTPALQDFVALSVETLTACFEALKSGQPWQVPEDFTTQAQALIDTTARETSPGDELLQANETASLFDIESILVARLGGDTASEPDVATDATLAHTITAFAELAAGLEFESKAQLAEALGGALERVHAEGGFAQVALGETQRELLLGAYDALLQQLNQLAVGDVVTPQPGLIAQLRSLDVSVSGAEPTEADPAAESPTDAFALEELTVDAEAIELAPSEPAPESTEQADSDPLESLFAELGEARLAQSTATSDTTAFDSSAADAQSEDTDTESDAEIEAPQSVAPDEPDMPNLDDLDVDDDLVQVFFEEAEEINEELEASLASWSDEPNNRIYLENLLRGLHTLKGGARLCGLVSVGDMAHDFESVVIAVQNNEREVDEALFSDLHQRFDALVEYLGKVAERSGEATEQPASVQQATPAQQPDTQVVDLRDENAAPQASQAQESTSPDQRRAELEAAQRDPRPAATGSAEPPAERSQQEMVRVGSALLEELVNLAGENSILRARIEQGMSDFTSALDEMETTIERLREQLRRLEIETETQVLFRHEREDDTNYANFDPLEMDRYSQLQQLSRSLSESASDMLDLKDTLLFKARESETLLLQQARINTELQEGLMRTRMVPFSRLLPRLRRIVRQVSGELGKEVEFHVQNAEGELDRNLLERMVPPLEHMLRNALDHGIEAEEVRRNFGKPGKGRIDLRLTREGGDVVIEISDDGAGIDVEGVRAKAIERGLTTAAANLSDEEVMQFVLAPGFSTAKSVTQISGRGVGMDVVHSEVKQLGGSIGIMSRAGQGTRFVVRVPFTVSVNRALMVSVAEDLYAIPLNTIEGIVLLSPEQVEELYQGSGNTFEYAGVPYRVRYLGQYLGREYRGAGVGQTSVPMVLVRSGDHAVAIHVDMVQGSREIVVKSLGPQFAGVGGISGATILGDGSVVVILDLLALIRAQQHQQRSRGDVEMPASGSPRCVLVVDDSVTVRKVTSRLLERQGMEVIVAKDGIEAVALLQERRPDIMLLDIEMPRMDGFEVARQVRHDDRLESLPIVMISSRTGEKHKEHADQLGVNRFLGKPFQENELLATIDELVTRS